MNTYSYKLFSITLHKISLITFQMYARAIYTQVDLHA